jgi:hypothetical protein
MVIPELKRRLVCYLGSGNYFIEVSVAPPRVTQYLWHLLDQTGLQTFPRDLTLEHFDQIESFAHLFNGFDSEYLHYKHQFEHLSCSDFLQYLLMSHLGA